MIFLYRDSSTLNKSPLIKTRSDGAMSPRSLRPSSIYQQSTSRGTTYVSDIHLCVLCLKALMNNAVCMIFCDGFLVCDIYIVTENFLCSLSQGPHEQCCMYVMVS